LSGAVLVISSARKKAAPTKGGSFL